MLSGLHLNPRTTHARGLSVHRLGQIQAGQPPPPVKRPRVA